MATKTRDLVRALKAAGWKQSREGDHTNYSHPNPPPGTQKLIQVGHHREIAEPLARKILRDAGLR